MTSLAEDDIDDLLYLARANELADLQQLQKDLSAKHNTSFSQLLPLIIDPETGNGPLHYASANGHTEIVRTLLGVQASADPTDADEKPPAPATIVNAKNKSGNTPLHWAALNGHLDVILLLLKQGADPTILNSAGHDALFEAELNEKQEAVELLLGEGTGLDQGLGGDDTEKVEDVEDDAVAGSDIGVNGKEDDGADVKDQMDVDHAGEVAKG